MQSNLSFVVIALLLMAVPVAPGSPSSPGYSSLSHTTSSGTVIHVSPHNSEHPFHNSGYPSYRTQYVDHFFRNDAPKLRSGEHTHVRKKCPPGGYDLVGDNCVKKIFAEVQLKCPKDTTLIENKCVQYFGKKTKCPPGYKHVKDRCYKKSITAPEPKCPPNFTLKGAKTCVMKIELPAVQICPSGAIEKGDVCVVPTVEFPDYVCPNGYKSIGKYCQRREVFDCTPPREKGLYTDGDYEVGVRMHFQPELVKSKENKDVTVYRIPEAAPFVEEYVMQKTCKRIITELARPVCSKGGFFDGKVCIVDHVVDRIPMARGWEEKITEATRSCPHQYFMEGSICVKTHEVLPELVCPENTYDIGDRCVIYTDPILSCPAAFYLEGDACVKYTHHSPLTEYDVTVTCKGKGCNTVLR